MLHADMKRYAENMQFEEAQKRKLSLEALESLSSMQVVRDGVKGNYFVIQLLEKYDKYYVGIIQILDGKIVKYENMEIENKLEQSASAILTNIVEKYWVENTTIPRLVFLLPQKIDVFHTEIVYEIPEMGAKYELLKLCYKNIYEYAHKKHLQCLSTKAFSKKTMQHILTLL